MGIIIENEIVSLYTKIRQDFAPRIGVFSGKTALLPWRSPPLKCFDFNADIYD